MLLLNNNNNNRLQKRNNNNDEAFWSSFSWAAAFFKTIKMITNLNNIRLCQKQGFHNLSNPKISFGMPISAIIKWIINVWPTYSLFV